MAIVTSQTARRFAQSVATLGVMTQNAIDASEWENAENLLEDITTDVEKLQAFIRAKIEALNEER